MSDGICDDCKRPLAANLAQWRSGFPPGVATTGDYCGLSLSRVEHNDTTELERNCMQTAWSNALVRVAALEAELADVRTLDAHAADRKLGVPIELRPNSEVPLDPERAWYCYKPYTSNAWYGPTPEAARAKAADWVRENGGGK
jgi:hypothetical protein